jgi:hypothetical protein
MADEYSEKLQDEESGSSTPAKTGATTILATDQPSPSKQDDAAADLERSGTRASSVEYSVFSTGWKRYIVIAASMAGFFSPLSSQIYFPAMNTLAEDLHVSISAIDLTMTSYMVSLSPPLSVRCV